LAFQLLATASSMRSTIDQEEAMALTGRFNFRRSWFGKLVLEVEEELEPFFASDKNPLKRRWRRGTLMDLAEPEMRALIDLRPQRQFLSPTSARPVGIPPGVGAAADEPLKDCSRREVERPIARL
jgi:hypothetical protein